MASFSACRVTVAVIALESCLNHSTISAAKTHTANFFEKNFPPQCKMDSEVYSCRGALRDNMWRP